MGEKTPGCHQKWTKTSAKHGSSHIPITSVCSSKFSPLFSVVIILMLFKSLVVTSSLQPLKIMRYNFRKQKGTICVQETWAPSKCKQSLIHCQKVSETSHAEFTENIFQSWFWKLLIFETSWCNKVTEVRREVQPGGHVLERSEDVAGKFQYQLLFFTVISLQHWPLRTTTRHLTSSSTSFPPTFNLLVEAAE